MTQHGSDCLNLREHLTTDAEGRQEFNCSAFGPITMDNCRHCQQFKPLAFETIEYAVGITTVPERRQALFALKHQLRSRGFGDNPVISIDTNLELGPFGNFYLVATELYLRFPHASAYLICQDDIAVRAGAKGDLDRAAASGRSWAVLSLYTAPELENLGKPASAMPANGWRIIDRGWQSPGACAYLFSDWGLRDLLSDQIVLAHRRLGPSAGARCLDSVIGVWASKHGGILHHDPPLAVHLGLNRVLPPDPRPVD